MKNKTKLFRNTNIYNESYLKATFAQTPKAFLKIGKSKSGMTLRSIIEEESFNNTIAIVYSLQRINKNDVKAKVISQTKNIIGVLKTSESDVFIDLFALHTATNILRNNFEQLMEYEIFRDCYTTNHFSNLRVTDTILK
jgi:hypothetical protein